MRIISSVTFGRGSPVGDHVLLRVHVCPGQLLCVHDLLPCVRVPGAGGKASILRGGRPWIDPHGFCAVCVSVCVDGHCCGCKLAVEREPGGPSHLAAEPLQQGDGGGGQQAQPRDPEGQDDHGKRSSCVHIPPSAGCRTNTEI